MNNESALSTQTIFGTTQLTSFQLLLRFHQFLHVQNFVYIFALICLSKMAHQTFTLQQFEILIVKTVFECHENSLCFMDLK